MLMTEATTTTEGQTASQTAAETNSAGLQTSNDGQAAQQQATSDASQASSQDGNTTGESSSEAGKPSGAPEQYSDFSFPEGAQMDAKGIEAFTAFAKDSNLSQEAAQALIDKMAPAMAERQVSVLNEARQMWADQSRGDKEFGGSKLDASVKTANDVLTQYGTPELRTLLVESGLGNHPEVIRVLSRVGNVLSADSVVTGSTGAKAPASTWDSMSTRLYPSQQ